LLPSQKLANENLIPNEGGFSMAKSQQTDRYLLDQLKENAAQEAQIFANGITLLRDLEREKAWARLGCPSFYDFCQLALGLTRSEAFCRTKIAKLANSLPNLSTEIRNGTRSPWALRVLASHLTPDNFEPTFERLTGKNIRDIEEHRNLLTAQKNSDGPIRGHLRHITQPTLLPPSIPAPQLPHQQPEPPLPTLAPLQKGLFECSPQPPQQLPPLPPQQAPQQIPLNRAVRIAITVPHTTWEKYERVCNLANHSNCTSDLAKVFDVLVENYLKHHDPALKTPRASHATAQNSEHISHSRYIPSHIKIEVWKRDAGQCTYRDVETGERCPCKRGLQFDHIEPFAWGGKSNTPSNIRLLCDAHNRLMAEQHFGKEKMARSIALRNSRNAYTLPPKHGTLAPEKIDF
jgi:hypothetical protein